MSCVDSRSEEPVFGTPGGDIAELMGGVTIYLRQTGVCLCVCAGTRSAACGFWVRDAPSLRRPLPFAHFIRPPPLAPRTRPQPRTCLPQQPPTTQPPPPSPRRPPKGLSFSQTLVDGVVREFLDSRYVSKARPFYFHTGDDKLRDVYSAINTEFNKDYARLPDVAPANAEERNTWLDELSKVSGRRRSVRACASAARARALTSAQSVPAVRRTPAFCYLLPACCLGLFHPAQSGRC